MLGLGLGCKKVNLKANALVLIGSLGYGVSIGFGPLAWQWRLPSLTRSTDHGREHIGHAKNVSPQ